jgi:hypothetical protein
VRCRKNPPHVLLPIDTCVLIFGQILSGEGAEDGGDWRGGAATTGWPWDSSRSHRPLRCRPGCRCGLQRLPQAPPVCSTSPLPPIQSADHGAPIHLPTKTRARSQGDPPKRSLARCRHRHRRALSLAAAQSAPNKSPRSVLD